MSYICMCCLCGLWRGNCLKFAKNEWIISVDTAGLGGSNIFADMPCSGPRILLCIYISILLHTYILYKYIIFTEALHAQYRAVVMPAGFCAAYLFLSILLLHLRFTFVCSFVVLCSAFCESSLVHFRFRSIMSTSVTRKCFWNRRKRSGFCFCASC